MSEDRKALDLDELFGQAKNVTVRWEGKEYHFLRLEALSPKQIVRFQGMQKRAAVLQVASVKKELTDQQSTEIEKLFDEMLGMLCQDFPLDTIPFAAKTKALDWYLSQNIEKKSQIAKLKQQTGATRSRR